MKLKFLPIASVAEIQEAVIGELNKVQKIEIFGSFSETVRPRKAYIYMCVQ
jgi:hypothetical protein